MFAINLHIVTKFIIKVFDKRDNRCRMGTIEGTHKQTENEMNSYLVRLYVDGSLDTYQVYANDREDAQDKVIEVIEQVQRVHGEIVSIKLIKDYS